MQIQVFTGKTATFTSAGQNIEALQNISLQFIAASIASGNGVFTMDVSNDGINWVAYSMLIDNVTNTNGQTLTRVASKTLSSNTSVVVALDAFGFKMLRVKVTVTTDGSYDCVLYGNRITN